MSRLLRVRSATRAIVIALVVAAEGVAASAGQAQSAGPGPPTAAGSSAVPCSCWRTSCRTIHRRFTS